MLRLTIQVRLQNYSLMLGWGARDTNGLKWGWLFFQHRNKLIESHRRQGRGLKGSPGA